MVNERLSPEKSTTVRSIASYSSRSASLRWLRLLLRAGSHLAPGWVERYAANRFFTPATRRDRPAPSVPGVEADFRVIPCGPFHLATWSWGSGPLVLLVHGWNGHAGQMTGLVRLLLEKGFRVMTFDAPAHGRSSGRRASLPEIAEALLALGRAVGPLEAVIAHSLGGSATAVAMSRGLEAKRTVLIAPAAEPTLFARQFARYLGLTEPRVEGMLRQMTAITGVEPASLALQGLVGGLRQPMLLLHDPADPVVPRTHAEAIAGAWPEARLHWVSGPGHFRILKHPGVIERITAFLM